MNLERIYSYSFKEIYNLYVSKVQRKNQSVDDLNTLIYWLTGYDEAGLKNVIDSEISLKDFFVSSPRINQNYILVTGVICGVRIESIEDDIYKKIRVLDKLVDELAKGRAMSKIMREEN